MNQPNALLNPSQSGATHPPATPPSQTEDTQPVYALTPYDDRNVSVGEIADYLDQLRLEAQRSCI